MLISFTLITPSIFLRDLLAPLTQLYFIGQEAGQRSIGVGVWSLICLPVHLDVCWVQRFQAPVEFSLPLFLFPSLLSHPLSPNHRIWSLALSKQEYHHSGAREIRGCRRKRNGDRLQTRWEVSPLSPQSPLLTRRKHTFMAFFSFWPWLCHMQDPSSLTSDRTVPSAFWARNLSHA